MDDDSGTTQETESGSTPQSDRIHIESAAADRRQTESDKREHLQTGTFRQSSDTDKPLLTYERQQIQPTEDETVDAQDMGQDQTNNSFDTDISQEIQDAASQPDDDSSEGEAWPINDLRMA